jgi:hypothetical protein
LEYVTTYADIHGFCVHTLRATTATNALAHNADIAKVQEWLGHADIRLCVVMAKDVEVAYLFQPFRCRVTDLPGVSSRPSGQRGDRSPLCLDPNHSRERGEGTMRTVGWYTWGKTEKGYGWNVWAKPGLAIERDSRTGHYEVYEASGTLLCRCVDYRSVQRVVAHFRRQALQSVTLYALPQAGVLGQTTQGEWLFHMIDQVVDYGETFPTREAAEAYIFSRPQPTVH